MWSASGSAAPPTKRPTFPRVERYTEETPDGGRAVVKRCVVPLTAAQQKSLLAENLDGGAGAALVDPVTIVWLDAQRWFVAGFEAPRAEDCAVVLEGSLREFLTYSPLTLARVGATARLAGSGLELSVSPGMPNTRHFTLKVEPDGRFTLTVGGYMATGGGSGFEPHLLTSLLVNAQRAGLDQVSQRSAAPPFAHDAQVTTLRLWLNGRRTEMELDTDAKRAFVAEVMKAYRVNEETTAGPRAPR